MKDYALVSHAAQLFNAQTDAKGSMAAAGIAPLDVSPTGSAYYGKPNPQDFDVLVWVGVDPSSEGMDSFVLAMAAQGWEDCAGEAGGSSGGDTDSEDYRVSWCALRKQVNGDSYNIIATTDRVWYTRQCAASELVRRINYTRGFPMTKEETIMYFRMVREGTED